MEESVSWVNDLQFLVVSSLVLVLLLLLVLLLVRKSHPERRLTIRDAKVLAAWGLKRVASQFDGYIECNITQLLDWCEDHLLSGSLVRSGARILNDQLSSIVRQKQGTWSVCVVGIPDGCEYPSMRNVCCVVEGGNLVIYAQANRDFNHRNPPLGLNVRCTKDHEPPIELQTTVLVKSMSLNFKAIIHPTQLDAFAFSFQTLKCKKLELSAEILSGPPIQKKEEEKLLTLLKDCLQEFLEDSEKVFEFDTSGYAHHSPNSLASNQGSELVGIGGGTPLEALPHQILVHVIEGRHLAARHRGKEYSDAYVVLEVDDHEQKAQQTTVVKKTASPEWHEVFAFNLTERCSTLLLAVYHSDLLRKNECLGRGSVPLNEVPMDRAITKTLHLKMPEGWEDEATSMITLRLERKAIPEWEKAMASHRRSRSRSRSRERERREQSKSASGSKSGDSTSKKGTDSSKVASRQIKELRMRSLNPTTPTGNPPLIMIEQPSPLRKSTFNLPTRSLDSEEENRPSPTADSVTAKAGLPAAGPEEENAEGPGDGVSRKRATEPAVDTGEFVQGHRRTRSADSLNLPELTEKPTSLSKTTAVATEDHDKMSVASGASARSLAGSQNSMLVIETLDDPPQFFLIPQEMAENKRYGVKGQKLHIFNDHVFVATHFSWTEPPTCEHCQKEMDGFGKQGYLCRGCGMHCHKKCHNQVEKRCTSSLANDMDLIFYGETSM